MKHFPLTITLVALLSLSISCTKESEEETTSLYFEFTHSMGSQALIFDTIQYTNTFGNEYSVATLQYFVSEIELTHSDGHMINLDHAYYLDARNEEGLSFKALDEIPTGSYTKLSFVFGLSEEKNTNGAYVNPPESLMEWPLPMGGGYHYMKLEGKHDSLNTIKNFQAHTGRLMETSHTIRVDLNLQAQATDGNPLTLVFNMDINQWWEEPNILDLNAMSGIMGNENMQQRLQENGATVFSTSVK